MNTVDIGNNFYHFIGLKAGTPFLHSATTNELDEPYRHSDSLVVRLFPVPDWCRKVWGLRRIKNGLVVGRWEDTDRTQKEALLDALRIDQDGGHDFDTPEKSLSVAIAAAQDEDLQEGDRRP